MHSGWFQALQYYARADSVQSGHAMHKSCQNARRQALPAPRTRLWHPLHMEETSSAETGLVDTNRAQAGRTLAESAPESDAARALQRGGLEVVSIAKSYDKRAVLTDISLSVGKGEVLGLLGPNGAGKTTCFYSIMGLVRPDSGRILLDGVDITRLPMYRRAILGLGYLPQETSIFRGMTVEQNMALSGGERRRCEIARALAANPSIILLDEPFAGIDPLSISDIRHLVIDLKNRGIGVLITDHNVRETLDIVDRACIIYGGQVLFAGSPEALVADPNVRRLYLGEGFTL